MQLSRIGARSHPLGWANAPAHSAATQQEVAIVARLVGSSPDYIRLRLAEPLEARLKEKEGLLTGVSIERYDPTHCNGVVTARVLGAKRAVYPCYGMIEQRVAGTRCRVPSHADVFV